MLSRQEANKEILNILGPVSSLDNLPTSKMLDSVDIFDVHAYIRNWKKLNYYVETLPYYRFIQILWALQINRHSRGEGDRFYEESEETLNKLKLCLENQNINSEIQSSLDGTEDGKKDT